MCDKAISSLRPGSSSQCSFQLSEKSLPECHEAKRKRIDDESFLIWVGLMPRCNREMFLPHNERKGRVLPLTCGSEGA